MNKLIYSLHPNPDQASDINRYTDSYKLTGLLRLLCFSVLLFCSSIAKGQIVSFFKATDTAGCAPLIIHFANVSTGATSYSWDLGNGITSTLKDVSASYVTSGTYTVTLRAYNGTAYKDSSLTIKVYGKPVVDFYASDTAVCPVTPITFHSTSTPNCWGFLSYTWNFGDGGADAHDVPTHAYVTGGRYNVTLFAINAKGCVNTKTRTGYIDIFNQPLTLFSAPTSYFCKAPGIATFSNGTTGKTPISYRWSFGDGGTSTLTNPSHTYTASGSYNVKIIAVDANSCADSLLQNSFIGLSSFKTSFTPIANGCLFSPVKFVYTGSPYTSIKWDFGDGRTLVNDTGFHTYTTPGIYTVKLVTGNDTCTDSVTHTISIQKPTGSFTVTPPCMPASTLNFSAAVASSDSVTWLFGDGTGSTGKTTTHSYHPKPFPPLNPPPDPVYNIAMIVTDPIGCTDTVSIYDSIKNLYAFMGHSGPDHGCLPLAATFKVDALFRIVDPHPPGGFENILSLPYPRAITSYLWDFGDGSPTSSTPLPSHTYTATGKYLSKCHIVMADGCSADDSMEIMVGTPPAASFTMSKTHACAGAPITYTSTSTPPALINDYSWVFGDGKNAEDPTYNVITHRSEVPGIHTVALVALYNGCKSNEYKLTDTIDAANANIQNQYTCIPKNGMVLIDSSIGDDTHLWQFGDGTTSTAKNPVHFYPALLSYSVTLTTYNIATGCRDTGRILIELERPSSTLASYHTKVCKDAIDSFTTHISPTDSTYPLKCFWYDNGIPTDIHIPVNAPNPPLLPNYFDTVYHPLHTRDTNNVVLVLLDNHSCRDTMNTIVIVPKPIDSFIFTPATTCPSSSVSFTDQTKDVATTTITGYYWAFGDGVSTTAGIPTTSHIYTTAGTYSITERTVDNIGCRDTFTNSIKLIVHRPKAGFIASSTYTCNSTTISFNNTSVGSYTYLWDFGDGATSTLSLPTHTYTVAGDYDVKLVAFDAFGCTDTLFKQKYVTVNPLPVASFHMDDSFAVCPPLTVNFINTSTGATFNQWDLGDGTYSISVYPSNIYTSSGDYVVKLKVSNQYGCIDTAEAHARVFGYVGAFKYTPDTVCTSAPVHFNATLSDVINIVWDFNDGVLSSPSLLDTISHIYTTPGSYMPKLFLTDVSGCTKFSYGADTIKVDSVLANFTDAPDPVCKNSNVTFHDVSYSYFSSSKAWLWTFGSGATSTLSTPAYAYTVSGSQPATLSVTDGLGCTATATKTVSVTPGPDPIAGTNLLCLGQSSNLSDLATPGTWSSSKTTVATVGSTGIVTSVAVGTTVITYTLANGCSINMTLTVAPVPVGITGVKELCAGSKTTLSDASPGGAWTSTNTAVATMGTTNGAVNGIAAGTSSITYRFPSGCAASVTVTVDPAPAVILPVSPVLCAGNAITLTDAVTGGSWTSSATTVASIGTASGVLTGISSGSATITYTLASGCSTITTTTINALPAAITGKANVCAGHETSLTDATPGGAWSSSNTAIAVTGSTAVVSGIAAGTITVTYTLPTGCFTTTTLVVNPQPTAILGKKEVCKGLTTTLSDAAGGGIWTRTGTSIGIGSTSGMVTGISPGSAYVTYTLGTGCQTIDSVLVDPLPTAILGSDNICIGLVITLSDATPSGRWSSAATTVSVGPTTGVISGLATGTATIYYTLPTGCTVADTLTINPLPAAIKGTLLLCIGDATALSDSVTGGTWATTDPAVSIGATSGLVTGLAAGIAVVTYTSGAGCIAITTVTVNPNIAPIKGATTVCKGATTTLSDDITGGTWNSTNTSVAVISTSGMVTGLATGTTVISYAALNTCHTATTTVTVRPLPDAGVVKGVSRLCSGSSAQLHDTTAGGVWTSGNNTVASVDTTGLMTGLAAGTVQITYTYTNSCGKADAEIAVTVNQTPPKTHITTHPDTVLCSNTLFQNFGTDAPEPTGFRYSWSASNATIYAMAANRQYCLVSFPDHATGIIRLSTAQANTGCISMDSLVYHIGAEIAPHPVVVYYQPEFVCKDNTAESYQWGFDDVISLDSTLLYGMVNQNYQNGNPDFAKKNYWVITIHNGCLQKSYYNAPTGINFNPTTSNIEIHLYPNPADEKINIEVNGISRLDIIEAKLFDMLGKERKIVSIIDGKGSIQLGGLSPGVYMVMLSRDGEKLGSKVFVKE